MGLRIIVIIDDIAPKCDRFVAMEAVDFENYEPEYHAGRAATPLEAVADLLWRLDLPDETPYCLSIRDR
jgi:hypothetical protein